MSSTLPPWRALLVLGLGAIALYALTDSVWVETIVAVGLSAATFAAVSWRALSARVASRGAWQLLAVASGLWLLGWIPWQAAILQTGTPPASFSVADGLFISSAIALAAGVLGLIRSAEPRQGGTIEAAMLTLVLALGSWLTVIGPAFERGALEGAAGRTQAAYALLDVVLVAVLARALLGTLRTTAYRLLLAGVGALLVANTLWNWLALAGSYTAGGYYDLGWLLYTLLLGAGALHPSAPCAGARREVKAALGRRHVAILLLAGLSLPALAWAELVFGGSFHTPATVGAATVLTLLVLLRAVALLRESERLGHALARQNAELKELDRLKDDFVASVSHELRTPLTSIRGYLELVRDGEAGELTEQQDAFLEVVDRNAERLLRVVGDLLFVAQLDAGATAIEPAPADPAVLVEHARAAAEPIAEQKGLTLASNLGALPETIEIDASRISQALDNLVSNAVKFTPAGGTVTMSAHATNGHVELAVRDSGPGIAAGDQERLFERFFRTADATDQAIAGTGLGLAITKAIVEAHGGSIELESAPGAGSTFRILLPVTHA